MFESLSDLQAIQSATRKKILLSDGCKAPEASEAGKPCPRVLERGSSASVAK